MIKLNNRVHKTGRPKIDRKLNEAKDRQDRVVFNASEKAKRDLGEVTLKGVLDSILNEKPSVEQTLKLLETIPVKFQEHENKKPKYMRQRNPIVIVDVFYLLPPRLLEACIKKLPLANSNDDAISVYSQSQSQTQSQSQDQATELSQSNQVERQTNEDDDVELISIANIGMFRRDTIQVMKALSDLRAVCVKGEAFCRWMLTDMAVAVRAEDQDEVNMLSTMVLSKFPYSVITSLGGDYHYHMLYRLQPPQYVNDAMIRALCERLEGHHPTVRYGGMLTAKATKRRRDQDIDPAVLSRLTFFLETSGIDTVLLPVNFGNHHWCCIIIDYPGFKIRYYDPAHIKDYRTALDALSWQLVKESLDGFSVVSINSPIQVDWYSCGILVCFKFWNICNSGVPTDLSDTAITRRRFELLRYILGGDPPTRK
ncbi:hypothetical protein ATCC90586_011090 [Pythium insidiosum]|nr:hypothetical protein ATCC90586_011090 [Pythium insidiosum]